MDFLPQNAAHWHTIIAHIPLFGLSFSLVLLLLAAAMKDGRFQRVALVFIILTGVAAYFIAEAGEKAEDIVEKLPGVEHSFIEYHEQTAEVAVFALYGLGAIALIILLTTFKQKVLSGKVVLVFVILTLLVTGWIAYVNKLGGQINHPENRPGFIAPGNWLDDDDGSDDEEDDI